MECVGLGKEEEGGGESAQCDYRKGEGVLPSGYVILLLSELWLDIICMVCYCVDALEFSNAAQTMTWLSTTELFTSDSPRVSAKQVKFIICDRTYFFVMCTSLKFKKMGYFSKYTE